MTKIIKTIIFVQDDLNSTKIIPKSYNLIIPIPLVIIFGALLRKILKPKKALLISKLSFGKGSANLSLLLSGQDTTPQILKLLLNRFEEEMLKLNIYEIRTTIINKNISEIILNKNGWFFIKNHWFYGKTYKKKIK